MSVERQKGLTTSHISIHLDPFASNRPYVQSSPFGLRNLKKTIMTMPKKYIEILIQSISYIYIYLVLYSLCKGYRRLRYLQKIKGTECILRVICELHRLQSKVGLKYKSICVGGPWLFKNSRRVLVSKLQSINYFGCHPVLY